MTRGYTLAFAGAAVLLVAGIVMLAFFISAKMWCRSTLKRYRFRPDGRRYPRAPR